MWNVFRNHQIPTLGQHKRTQINMYTSLAVRNKRNELTNFIHIAYSHTHIQCILKSFIHIESRCVHLWRRRDVTCDTSVCPKYSFVEATSRQKEEKANELRINVVVVGRRGRRAPCCRMPDIHKSSDENRVTLEIYVDTHADTLANIRVPMRIISDVWLKLRFSVLRDVRVYSEQSLLHVYLFLSFCQLLCDAMFTFFCGRSRASHHSM